MLEAAPQPRYGWVSWPAQERVVRCPEPGCGQVLRLVQGKAGLFYGCPRWVEGCRGAVRAHRDGRPQGHPLPHGERRWRKLAHEALDGLWREGRMTRSLAYAWLAQQLERPTVHIGDLDGDDCWRVIQLVAAYRDAAVAQEELQRP